MSVKHEHESVKSEDGNEKDEPVATPEGSGMGLLPKVWGNEVGGGSVVVVRVVVWSGM